MATVPSMPGGPRTPKSGHHPETTKDQLRKDRIHAAITVVVLIAVFAFAVWLASIVPESGNIEMQHWVMP